MDRIPRWVPVSIVTTCIAGVVIMAVFCILVFMGAAANEERDLDYVIVLGARVKEHTVSNSLKKRLDKAIEYAEKNPETYLVMSQVRELMAMSFLVYINRLLYSSLHEHSQVFENALYLKICDYIHQNLEDDLSLERIAANFYVSKYHIAHIFKDNMGISLHQYILKKRLHASRQAILSGEPISRIFPQYGFKDYTSFFRAFKKEYGISPKEYREQHRLIRTEP